MSMKWTEPKALRRHFIIVGLFLSVMSFLPQKEGMDVVYWVSGTIAILVGCYLWTRIKNRHWVFTLWGLLAPIGLLGISLLKAKNKG